MSPAAIVPAALVGRLAETLDREHAEHLVAAIVTTLAPYMHPNGERSAGGRPLVDVVLVARLVVLLGPTRGYLLPSILSAAGPWLATSGPPASTVELTDVELAALTHASYGHDGGTAARAMGYTADGVKSILRRAYAKLDAVDRGHAVRRGFETGVLVPTLPRAES